MVLPPNSGYPTLRIFDLTSPNDARRLSFLLSDQYENNDVEELDNETLLQRASGRRLLSAIINNLITIPGLLQAPVRTAVVELDYVDRDTNIAYVQLHARAFRTYPRRTLRLHFFSEPLTYSSFVDEQALQSSYLGFCVLSPAKPRTIGRTVLSARHDRSIQCFVPTQSEFSVNLGGASLKAKGTAFIEQDGRVAACASAAIWMSTNIAARRWNDMIIRSTAEITQFATRYSLPALGSGESPGLSIEQIIWALHEMGYEPIVHKVLDSHKAQEIIYSYVESGIPPILTIYLPSQRSYHAITVVGHSYDPNPDQNDVMSQLSKGIQSTSVWYPNFLIHDDQMGPYLKVKISPSTSNSDQQPVLLLDEPDSLLQSVKNHVEKWYQDASLDYIIAPFPPRHTLRFESAAHRGKALLIQAYNLYRRLIPQFNLVYPSRPIYRTYFIPSNEYKRHFVPGLPGLSPEVADWYRGSTYSRYIWVTELCSLEQHASTPRDLRIIADVTIDATSSPSSRARDFITLHIPRLFFRMSPEDTNVAIALQRPATVFIHDTPYQPFLRY